MKKLILGALVMSFSILLPTEAADEKPMNPLKGTWTLKKAVNNGEVLPEARVKGSLIVIKDEQMIANDRDNNLLYVLKYALVPEESPKRIKMMITKGRDKGRTARGIYEMKGKKLRICYSYDDSRSPKDFTTKKGDMQILLEMERVK